MLCPWARCAAAEAAAPSATAGAVGTAPGAQAGAVPASFLISEYRVHGAHALSADEIGAAVYPYLGPARREDDVRAACTALEDAYRAKGFGAVAVHYDAGLDAGALST